MAQHELKDHDKSDELVDMIEKLMEDFISQSSDRFSGRSGRRRHECENLSQHGLLEREYGMLSAN